VARARGGDRQAWDALVERYAPLIWSICRKYRLGRADADDVGQSVWLRLVDYLDQIRESAALPGWLATTTRRECARLARAAHGPHAALYPLDAENMADEQAGAADQNLLAAERHAALRQAFAGLPADGQQLIACSSPTRRCPTPRSAPGWASRSAASARPVAAAWTGCVATRPSRP
jgi:RNA polymerase sigma factor (sigma-70 family)